MTIDSFDVLFFTVGFLVPGFVWSAVLSMLVPSRPQETETRFLSFLTFSCINYGLWSWVLYPMFRSGFSEAHPVWSGIALFVIILALPANKGVMLSHEFEAGCVQGEDAEFE
jgi:hypothetical protein